MNELNTMTAVNEMAIGTGERPEMPPNRKKLNEILAGIKEKKQQPSQSEIFNDKVDKEKQEAWAREDTIRKETQDREDNAVKRKVDDMRRAGVNPNLTDITGAASGGGITQSSKKDFSELIMEIEKNFKGSQADKDRLIKLLEIFLGQANKTQDQAAKAIGAIK